MKDGLQSQCTDCHKIHSKRGIKRLLQRNPQYNTVLTRKRRIKYPGEHAAYEKKRQEAIKARTPQWADLKLIEMKKQLAKYLTEVTGIKWTIDHIIPLQGKNISGLHCPENIRVIPSQENQSKSNLWQSRPKENKYELTRALETTHHKKTRS